MTTAAPTIQEIYAKFYMRDSAVPQMQGFTANAFKQYYQAAMRREMTKLGYSGRVINITDPGVLKKFEHEAQVAAARIQHTYNRFLMRDLLKGKTVDEILATVRGYNHDTLIPYQRNIAEQMAMTDFYANNPDVTAAIAMQQGSDEGMLSEIVPGDAVCQECIDAIAGNPYTESDAALLDPPFHQNCNHDLVPVEPSGGLDTSELPDESSLWTGE